MDIMEKDIKEIFLILEIIIQEEILKFQKEKWKKLVN